MAIGEWRGMAALAASAVAAATAAPAASPGSAASEAGATMPLVAIDTERPIVDRPKVTGRMKVIDRRRARPATIDAGAIGIEFRGSSSLEYPKKQYGVETRTAKGENRNVRLLGLPKENDWVLQGSYGDKTLMRNVVAYGTARALGAYASRTRYVELRVNGDYRGAYVLMETPKLDERRVAADDRDVTGGYLLELTARSKLTRGDRSFASSTGQALVHTDPEPEEMGPARTRWIREHVAAFESALHGPAFTDPSRGWRAYLDERSAVDVVLLNELFKNEDAFRSSLFLHKPSGAKLRLGPVWDFDVAMGNSSHGESARLEGWITTGRPWASRLPQDPAFADALIRRWRRLSASGLQEWLLRRVDASVRALGSARARNFRRWPIIGVPVWPNPLDPATGRPRTSYAAEVGFLRSWLTARVAWIDANVEALRP